MVTEMHWFFTPMGKQTEEKKKNNPWWLFATFMSVA